MSVIAPIPFALSTVLMIVGSTLWLFYIDPWMGAVALIVFPLLIGTNIVYEHMVSGHFTVAQDQLGDFSAGVHESFEGVQLVKAYGAETRETVRLGGLAEHVRLSRVRAITVRSWFEALLDVIPALTNILLVVLGAIRVDSGGSVYVQIQNVKILGRIWRPTHCSRRSICSAHSKCCPVKRSRSRRCCWTRRHL